MNAHFAMMGSGDEKFSPICSIMKRTIAGRLMRFSRAWGSRSPNHLTCS